MNLRLEMIRDIRDRYGFKDELVLSALEKVPRHKFAKVQHSAAYSDAPISIGHGQTMSQPYTVAYMTSLLLGNRENEILRQAQTFSSETQARRDDKTDRKIVSTLSSAKDWKVLEIGTGSGYQAAVLSDIVPEIYTVEIIPELYRKAKKRLRKLGYKNIHVKKGNGEFGWQEHAPYDRIIITAALEKDIPDELFDQLRVGGAIVAPIGSGKFQTMTRFTKLAKGNIKKEEFGEFIFVPFVTNK